MNSLNAERPIPSSLIRHISPPPPKRRKTSETRIPIGKVSSNPVLDSANTFSHVSTNGNTDIDANDRVFNNFQASLTESTEQSTPPIAAVEAGLIQIQDHLSYFLSHFRRTLRPSPSPDTPHLTLSQFANLYTRHQHAHGHHFVIHQHNHPRAGVHYDLRIQFSSTSSISFAVPKGLPGDPNSRSRGRLAVETRVHCLWNHLIESASRESGSLLIWDTGSYEVLPRKIAVVEEPQTTDNTDGSESDGAFEEQANKRRKQAREYENEKLIEAFQTRYIRLRLHGTRLPDNYTITLRLPSNSDFGKPSNRTHIRRKRSRMQQKVIKRRRTTYSTDSEPETLEQETLGDDAEEEDLDTDTEVTLETRLNNAYPGAHNTVGSIHQRHWFIMLDPRSCGFVRTGTGATGRWVRDGEKGFEVFHVRGRGVERSVVTGRLAAEVESDEGVEGYVGRKGWVGIEV